MKEITLEEIERKTNSPEAKEKEKRINRYVENDPNYTPGRKRPRDPEKEKLLKQLRW